jgi:hypothetical protein
MNFSGLEKIFARFQKKDSQAKVANSGEPKEAGHVLKAKEQLHREASAAPVWRDSLTKRYPDCSSVIESMYRHFLEFSATGVTGQQGYWDFRFLYFYSAGASNDEINSQVANFFPSPAVPKRITSSLGDHNAAELSTIVAELKDNGFYRFKTKLSSEWVTSVRENLSQAIANEEIVRTEHATESRIFFRESTLLACPELAQLAADPLFYYVASQYLAIEPVLGFLNSWISRPHSNDAETLSESAQMFHVDMSNPSFLKLFVYLNDVNDKNGPHCLVPKTHREKAPELWRDGRISDEEMSAHYPRSTWDYQTGDAGSVFLVDTKAFHKGAPLLEGERHLVQFYYVDTLFGEQFPLDSGTPAFKPARFGAHIDEYGPRFLSRFALGN